MSVGPGGVYFPVVPVIFIIDVLAKIFGGGRKVDPVIDAWNKNPAAMAGAWSTQIADAIKQAEDDAAELYVKTLKLIEDCYQPTGGVKVRRRRYQATDQYDRPIYGARKIRVKERHVTTQGGPITTGGEWFTDGQGAFYDFYSKINPYRADVVTYQPFTTTLFEPGAYMSGIPRPVMVWEPGNGGELFGVQGIRMENNRVSINNRWEAKDGICKNSPFI